MKRRCLVLPASERWEYPEDAYSRLDFASPPFISSSLDVANGVEWVEKMYRPYGGQS